jgi:hypothetical protein
MLAALPLAWRLGLAATLLLTVLGGVGGIYLKIRHDAYQDGYQRGNAEATAKCEKEKLAMELANQKAISDAEKKLLESERELASIELKLEDYINALDLMADEADGADDVCLYAPSVRRLEAIR